MKRPERVDEVRLAAARILLDWKKGRGEADRLLAAFEDGREEAARPLSVQQRGRLRELVFSCVRLRGRYDHLIEQLSHRAPADRARVVLWLGLHELLEMSTPDHAAISQSVALIRRLGMERAAGFVNSLLRRVSREGVASFFPRREDDPIGWAVHWLSHPRWLVERWARRWPIEEVLALCEADNRRPPVVLRCRPGMAEAVRGEAEARGWRLEPGGIAPDALVVREAVPPSVLLRELPSLSAIQDEGAQMVAPLLALPASAGRILDLCAAPGGKSLHLAELWPEATVVASDLSVARLTAVAQTRRRGKEKRGVAPTHSSSGGSAGSKDGQALARSGEGEGRVDLVAADGLAPPFPPESFDAVLVDAPCTGTGVLARRHEARWRRSPRDLDELPRLQRRLLHSAVDLCAPGGIIVYSTCSLEPEENDEVVDAVLAERDDLVEVGVQDRCDPRVVDVRRMRVLPQRHGVDGAFAAVLSRRERSS